MFVFLRMFIFVTGQIAKLDIYLIPVARLTMVI
jgi:hypothetical protein